VKITREIKVGLLLIITVALFIYGFNFLKGRDVFSKEKHYFAIYKTVGGLVPSSPVYINGLKVGLVKDIYFADERLDKVVVDFSMSREFSIPSGTVARIYSADLMGTKAIELVLGQGTVMARDGDTLASDIQASLGEEVNKQVLPLKNKAEALMGSIDSAMMVIRYVFNENTRENLEKSFASIKSTIENLEHTTSNLDTLMTTQRGRIAAIMGNLESITTNFKGNNQKISDIINNFAKISDTVVQANIGSTIRNLDNTLVKTYEIINKINSGEGSLGALINNDKLYRELEKSSKDLNLLLEDMRLNPDRYVQFSIIGRNPRKNTYKEPAK
jgi:phospholipid/cholesterol/gamma-HCH transport system substrate-binding protein